MPEHRGGDNALSALTHRTRAAIWRACLHRGEVAEWLKAADCKSARASVRWFESSPLHQSQHGERAGGEADFETPLTKDNRLSLAEGSILT